MVIREKDLKQGKQRMGGRKNACAMGINVGEHVVGKRKKMLSIVEPLVVCFSCSLCVVVRIETDGKRKKLLVGVVWQ